MNEIDRRAFFSRLLGIAVTTGVAAKIPGLAPALGRAGLSGTEPQIAGNTFLTPNIIVREALMILKSNMAFGNLATPRKQITFQQAGTD